MTSPSRYDVFLSHNTADQEAVEVLASRLRDEAKLHPFLDTWYLIPGTPAQEAIENALDQSETIAILLGPSGMSAWHNEESRSAIEEAVRSRSEYRVIPVLLPGAIEASLHRFLARRVWVDFRAGLDDAETFARLVAGIKGEAVEIGGYELPDEPAPYRGLLRFEAEHSRFFFGRDRERKHLAQKLEQQPFVALIGASGSGKSSLVRAGLLPDLAGGALPDSEHWQVLTLTPGSQPLRALADQLATLLPLAERPDAADRFQERLEERPDGLRTAASALLADQPRPLLLFVDQFEEVFTLCREGPERCQSQVEPFIANLADTVQNGGGRIRVLITLRADFLDRCLAFPVLRDLLQDRQVLLGPMAEADLREVIVKPAQAVGAFLEKGLEGMILRDVEAEPGALPLLQHALYELWRARRGPWLTIDAYEASGGVRGALERRAQATFEALTPQQQAIARNIFLRLTALGEGVSDTRRRVERDELYPVGVAAGQVDAVLQALSNERSRLVVTDEESVEVAHEALIGQWRTLREWLEENREALRVHRHLTRAAQEWEDLGRDPGELYRGARLAQAEEWAEQRADDLNPLEREFLQASLSLRDQELQEREAQRQRELETARKLAAEAEARRQAEEMRAQEQIAAATRLRRRAIVITIVALLAVAAFVFAVIQLNSAINNKELAEENAQLADARAAEALEAQAEAERQASIARAGELAAQSQLTALDTPQRSLLLAREAVLASDPAVPASEQALRDALRNIGGVPLSGHTGTVLAVAFSPDGDWFLTAGRDGTVRWWDPRAVAPGAGPRVLQAHEDHVESIAFSPGGDWLATGSQDGTARLWDVAALLDSDLESKGPADAHRVLSGHQKPVSSVAFGPDGRWLATGSWDGTARLWDLAALLDTSTGAGDSVSEPLVLRGHGGSVLSVAFSPDGQWLATASDDSTTRLWNLTNLPDTGTQDGEPSIEVHVLRGHKEGVAAVAFAPNGRWLATGSKDDTTYLWDLASLPDTGPQAETLVLRGHKDSVAAVTFSPNGRWLATAGDDGAAQVWDVDALLAANAEGGELLPEPRSLLGHEGAVTSVAFSPDGRWLATGSGDQTARLWDQQAENPAVEPLLLRGHAAAAWSAAVSPDGRWLATGSDDSIVRLWDVSALSGPEAGLITLAVEPLELHGHTDRVRAVSFDPQGRWLATGSWDNTVRLWDLATLLESDPSTVEGLVLGSHESGVTALAFSPDGRWLASGSDDRTIRLWDISNQVEVQVLRDQPDSVTSLAFSPVGPWLASGSWDGSARLWDVSALGNTDLADGDPAIEVRTLRGYQNRVTSVAFSPDGRLLATGGGGWDTTAWLWDVSVLIDTEAEISEPTAVAQVLRGHASAVNSVAFDPSGRWLATGSHDDTIRLWDLQAEDPSAHSLVLPGHKDGVMSVVFGPDGHWLATASLDTTAALWRMRLDELMTLACQVVGRNLAQDEWDQYFLGEAYRQTCLDLPIPAAVVDENG